MNYAMNNTDGVPVDLDLDAIMADLPLDLGGVDGIDEIVGEVPLDAEPESDEIVEAAEPAVDEVEEAPVTIEATVLEQPTEAPAPIADTTLADLDELLSVEIVTAEGLSDEESAALHGEIVKAEAYAAQEGEATVEGDDEIEAAPDAVTSAPKAKRAKKAAAAPAAPWVAKDIGTLAPEHFGLTEGVTPDEDAKTTLIGRRPKQVKIAEKFDGTIAALAAGRAPSVYVTKCFAALDARKEVTSGDLVAALQAAGYSIGTARSQAGQVMELFKLLEIADRAGQKLTLRAGSAFAAKLRALPAA